MFIAAALTVAVLAADRSDPAAFFSAEGKVVSVKVEVPGKDFVVWKEVTLSVTRCLAGRCAPHDLVRVRVPASLWRGAHGQHMGIVQYTWQDRQGHPRSWSVALSLDDVEEKERFDRETDVALAGGHETIESGTAVAEMKRDVPEPTAADVATQSANPRPVASR